MMKKTLLLSLLLAGAALCTVAQRAVALSGVISECTGTVELKRAGAAAFIAAKNGDEVAQDTIVSTGFRSTAVIKVGSSTIAVRPLTRLSLAEIASESDSESLKVDLQAGRVRVDVKPPAGTKTSAVVQSPRATASVRGTEFEFDTVNLRVYEGTVMLEGDDSMAIPVSVGATSFVNQGGAVDPMMLRRQSLTPPAPVGTGVAGKSSGTGASFALPSSSSSSSSSSSEGNDGTIIVTING